MPLIGNDDLVRIDLPAEGEFVMVKRKLSRGDQITVKQAVVRGAHVPVGGEDATLDAESAIEAAEFATLDVAIKAWSFPYELSAENIRALDGESIDAIKERLNELYPAPRTEEERKNSSGDGQPQSLTVVPSPTSLVG